MKRNNYISDTIKRIHSSFISSLGAAFRHALAMSLPFFLLLSCSDDVDVRPGMNETEFTGITLMLPDLEKAAEFGRTRDTDPTDPKTIDLGLEEATLKNLYIAVVRADGNEGNNVEIINLKETNSDKFQKVEGITSSNYEQYRINLTEGEYYFYLLGNLDSYIENWKNNLLTKDDVEKLILNFAGKVGDDKTLTPGNLPMACLATQMGDGNKTTMAAEGKINVPGTGSKTVYANLRFLCSKVRYTILFDKTDFSSKFTTTDINFGEAVTASNVMQDSPLDPDYDEYVASDPSGADKFTLSKVKYPSTEAESESDYLKSNRETAPDDLISIDENSSWTDASKRAWQGIAYLPENLEKEKATVLNFTASGSEMKSSYPLTLYWNEKKSGEEVTHAAHGIERANFYDVVIKLADAQELPQDENIIVNVYDWDRQALEYNIHGIYELEVEKTEQFTISSGEWSTMWFESNVPDSQIEFEIPKIKISLQGKTDSIAFFTAEVITNKTLDENGNTYDFDDNHSHFRIIVNEKVPFSVLSKLHNEHKFTDADNNEITEESLKQFHIVAGNIHKRIKVEPLNLQATLSVTPLRITIDTRELYMSGKDTDNDTIRFHTNYDDTNALVNFTLKDPNGLFAGKGNEALKLYDDSEKQGGAFLTPEDSNTYRINTTDGYLVLKLKDLLTTNNYYWNRAHEYTLTFTLNLPESNKTLEKNVIIVVKPFSSNYTIHFRDNTKEWESPHIYVYQLLTLPSDLPYYEDDLSKVGKENYIRHPYAGEIVGYIENNPSSGLQWNGAAQYVFTNNLSFRGWKGYGGPDINDPWLKSKLSYDKPIDNRNSNKSTMGFVMFGEEPDSDGSWNVDYCYTESGFLSKYFRYNYDVNFNEDHEKSGGEWVCEDCIRMRDQLGGDYNDSDDKRFYTGIAMEKDEENPGWWKYTLTGVAQPGRTRLFFANWHAPWDRNLKDYAAEDNRYPGDYETGIALFDFEDNEGWFLFNGNTTEKDQYFHDEKPTPLPLEFTSQMAQNLRVEFIKPNNYQRYQLFDQNRNPIASDESLIQNIGGKSYIDISNSSLIGQSKIYLQIYYNDNNSNKQFELPVGYFKLKDGKYTTADPLSFDFINIASKTLYIKWNNHVHLEGWNSPVDDSGYLSLYWGGWAQIKSLFCSIDDEVGNYRYVKMNVKEPSNPDLDKAIRDELIIQVGKNQWNGDFYKTLKIENLPKYYNPVKDYYQINVHLIEPITQ